MNNIRVGVYPAISIRIMLGWRGMEKTFSSLRSFVDVSGRTKFCLKCGGTATKEALFDVGGAMLIEKYCDTCAEKEVKWQLMDIIYQI
jgi:hypothetical protein